MHNLQYRLPAILIVFSFLLPIPAAQAEPMVTASRIIEAATNTLSPLNESIIADELTERYHHINEQLAKREYVPPNPEVIAKTKEQVQSFDCATVTDVTQIECEALVALFYSTNGAGWATQNFWLNNPNVENWYGVSTLGGHVQRLVLGNNQLTGSIPAELGNLTYLQELGLYNNQLSGPIPAELGNLSNLQILRLGRNQLSGSIPAELGNLTYLQELSLHNNQLSGSIPGQLGNLTNLQSLILATNQLSGVIPLSFVNLTNLERFYFYYTSLCEPTTPEFLAWKATVYNWYGSGIVCEEPEAPSWLLMYYVAADNNLNDVLLSEVGSIIDNRQPNVDIAIFVDSAIQDSAYRFFKHDGSVENFNMGNLNSGSGSTLADFILWAKSKSTAPQDALIISDHGHGLTGVAWDYRENRDNISVQEELRSALLTSGSVDVIYSHTCLTANMEFIWELRGLANFYVASESISFSTDHDYIDTIGLYTTASDLAVSMAESYYSFRNRGYTPSTVSVINMAYLDEMFVATNALALAIQEAPLAVKIDIWNLLDHTVLQRFHERGSIEINNVDRLADLFHFAALVNYFPELSPAAQTLLNLQNDFVVYNRAWSGVWEQAIWLYNNAKGVSIALPLNPASFYDGEWLEFAAGADWSFVNPGAQASIKVDGYNWGPMVSDLIAQNNPQDEDDPLPPEPLPLLISYGIYLPILIR